MPWDTLLSAASLGGFVFASLVLTGILYLVFQSARKGEFVPRSYHDTAVKQLTDANQALRVELHANNATMGRLADGVEQLSAILTRHDTDVRERVAAIQASVQQVQQRGT